jgi:hypothetical protein
MPGTQRPTEEPQAWVWPAEQTHPGELHAATHVPPTQLSDDRHGVWSPQGVSALPFNRHCWFTQV